MRITLHKNEVLKLLNILEKRNKALYFDIFQQYENEINKDKTTKQEATKTANKVKINKSKKLIQNAINLLRLKGEKINANTVSKEAGINYNTAHKYLKDFVAKAKHNEDEERLSDEEELRKRK